MAIVFGLLLALAAVLLVMEPLLRASTGQRVAEAEPLFSDSDDEADPLLMRRDRALAALKEIDFDKATGKLSDEDYARMKAQFTTEALEALRAADEALSASPPVSLSAAADEVEALIASARAGAGSAAGPRFCIECGATLDAGEKFCIECGAPAQGPGATSPAAKR